MSFRRLAAGTLCLCFVVLAAETYPSATEWSKFHDEHMALMQGQAQTQVRLTELERDLASHKEAQSGYPAALAIIELKLDGIRAIFEWLVGILTAVIVGGLGFFWRLLAHSRSISAKLDTAAGFASERDVKHTNRERDIQSNQQFAHRRPLEVDVQIKEDGKT